MTGDNLVQDSSQDSEEWALSSWAPGACKQERTDCRGPAGHRRGHRAGRLPSICPAEAGSTCELRKPTRLRRRQEGRPPAAGNATLSLVLSVLGGRAERAHVAAAPKRHGVGRFKDRTTENSEPQPRRPNEARIQPRTSPLVPGPGRSGHQGITERGSAARPCPARSRRLRSRGALTFEGGGQRGGLGAGGQAADGQVAFCASPVVQHAGVHCRPWGRRKTGLCWPHGT